LLQLVGWLAGRLRLRRLRGFESAYFPLRRWHVLLGEAGQASAELPACHLGWLASLHTSIGKRLVCAVKQSYDYCCRAGLCSCHTDRQTAALGGTPLAGAVKRRLAAA
jgi:hypothetical protein